ncbi:MAG: hypothetical protein IT373_01920 [Polyangiaceae bacterium]|nr:hypothetical protein [Polyangiaceae bacterium]
MTDEERSACELQKRLGPAARVVGEGVHWYVEIAHANRRCNIACFWYGEAVGLMLGPNPANSRAALRPSCRTRTGAEYLVRFHDVGRRVAGGRTRDVGEVVGAVRGWLEGKTIAGPRHCIVGADLCSTTFHGDGEASVRASFPNPGATVNAIRRWLEDGCSMDELRSLPSAVDASDLNLFDPD